MHTRTIPAVLAAGTLASLALLPEAARAQGTPDPMLATSRYQVSVVRLHPDMVSDWIAVQRDEVVPAMKKAGVPMRIVTRTVVGTNHEYTVITPFPRWEALDGPSALERALGREGAMKVAAKLNRATADRRTLLVFRYDSLSLPSAKGVVWRSNLRRYLPGKRPAFTELYRTEILPAMKKAVADGKLAGSGYAWGAAGAESGDFWTIENYPSFAAQDGGNPLNAALGAEKAAQVNAKIAEYSTSIRLTVSRLVPELSW